MTQRRAYPTFSASSRKAANEPALDDYPELQQATAKLEDPQQWDSQCGVWLLQIAQKMASEHTRLSDTLDDDRMQKALEDHPWHEGASAASDDVQGFVRTAIAQIYRSPELFLDCLVTADQNPVASAMPDSSHEPSVSGMLQTLVRHVMEKVVTKLVLEALPIDKARAAYESYQDLRAVWEGNYTSQRKVEEAIIILSALQKNLQESAGQGGEQLRSLSVYLDMVLPFLQSVVTQWSSIEDCVNECQSQTSLLNKLTPLIQTMDAVLADPLIEKTVGDSMLGSIRQTVGSIKQILAQVQLWETLPGSVSFSSWLTLLTNNPMVAAAVPASLLQLARSFAQLPDLPPYPADAGLSDQLQWLMGILAKTELHAQILPCLTPLLGSPEQATMLFTLSRAAEDLSRFPADASLADQALWLTTTLKQYQLPDLPESCRLAMQAVTGSDSPLLQGIDQLLAGTMPSLTLPTVTGSLTKMALPHAANWAASYLLPVHATDEMAKFYRDSSATESWASFMQRMGGSVATILKPYVLGQVMDHPLATETVLIAEALQGHTDAKSLVEWMVARASQADPAVRQAYSLYTNAVLLWQARQALSCQNPEEAEARLRVFARQMKDCQVVRQWPWLQKPLDLLPLLPGLQEARNAVGDQPAAESWLSWATQWLKALANSENPSLVETRQRLAAEVEGWIADGVMSVCDGLAQRSWGLLPTAEAASAATSSVSRAQTITSSGRLKMLGGLGMEGLGLGLLAYGMWRACRATAPRHAPEAFELTEIVTTIGPERSFSETSPALLRVCATHPSLWEMQRSALWQQRLPVLLGVSFMAAGAALLTDWARKDTPLSTREARALDMARTTIENIELPSIEPLFDASLLDSYVATPAEHDMTSPHTPLSNEVSSRKAAEMLQSVRTNILTELNENRLASALFDELFDKAINSTEVRGASPAHDLEIRSLLKTLQLTQGTIEELLSTPIDEQLYRAALRVERILKIVIRRHDLPLEIAAIRAYEQLTESVAETTAASNIDRDQLIQIDNLISGSLHQGMRRYADTINALYLPLFDAFQYIDKAIIKAIADYERHTQTRTHLRPESIINIRFSKSVSTVFGASQHFSIVRPHTLREIASGQYTHTSSTNLIRTSGKGYNMMATEHPRLVEALVKAKLRDSMHEELNAYGRDQSKEQQLEFLYQNLVALRATSFLAAEHKIPKYLTAVRKFLEGKLQAQTVTFHDAVLNGVFLIPVEPVGGVLFSVDDEAFFYVYADDSSSSLSQSDGRQSTPRPRLPYEDPNFRKWILGKIPLEASMHMQDHPDAFRDRAPGKEVAIGASLQESSTPLFNFHPTSSKDDLTHKLREGMLERTRRDLDQLVAGQEQEMNVEDLQSAQRARTSYQSAQALLGTSTGNNLRQAHLLLAGEKMPADRVTDEVFAAVTSDSIKTLGSYFRDCIMADALGACIESGPLAGRAKPSRHSVGASEDAFQYYVSCVDALDDIVRLSQH